MANQPLVSIIIPTYNRADLIGETLDSVIAQTYLNWECIVVDDGSTDRTAEVLKKYVEKDSRIQYHHRPNTYKTGGNGARNYGFDISKGKYINWFDSDDVMLENFLEIKLRYANFNLIISSHIIVDEFLHVIDKKIININYNSLMEDYVMWRSNAQFVTNNVLFKRIFLVSNNLRFNENILRGQESELFVRIFRLLKNDDLKVMDDCLFLYRQHRNTKTFENLSYNEKYKKDTIHYFLEILKYSISNEKIVLKNYAYKRLINFLIEAKFNSKANYNYVMLGLYKIFGIKFLSKLFVMLGYKYLNRHSKKIQVFLMNDSFI